ncbi:uncharacterized protein DNG_01896 [Cephalotrichum gorgonifer]|uniref:Uncharacterized protein n=1 Tax=Cephalotrichum gorgonifer TaxID=2041049 RepID=A0AAE8MSM7_9PEZI|nr:uncharacterized protein DNG_01896 [Cephalotrichum gorgonifer]
MDWDDVEMEDTPQANSLEAHEEISAPVAEPASAAAANDSTSPQNTDAPVLVPTKVHLRGVDTLTTDDIKSYASEHIGAAERVEWIDDTSANLVFGSEASAQDALVALCAIPIADPTQLPVLECLPAKPFSAKPGVSLEVRVAVSTDKKQAGAYARSRFYLLHPEYDPEERRRRDESHRSRYRDRDRDRDRRDRRGSRGRRSGRYEDEDDVTYDPSFYDDPDESQSSARPRRRRSSSRESTRRTRDRDSDLPRQRNSEKELFPTHRSGARARDRSASPLREDDSLTMRNALDDNRASAQQVKRRLSAANEPRELFPEKSGTSGLGQLDRLELSSKPSNDVFSIQGLAARRGDGDDFKLKGASTARVKELFPDKFGGNAGKELFDEDRLAGRGKRRQKAEDLFR